VRCLLGEQVITGPDRHVGEPRGDVLVPQHVQQGQVGAIGPGPDPVAGMRPAERRVQQCQVAGGHLHLIHGAEGEAAGVQAEGPADLAGPDDKLGDMDAERVRLLLREIFTAAGGTHDDWDTYDRVMAEEHRTAVLITPERVYSSS